MRVLLVVGNDANDQTYSKRAPSYNVQEGLRPTKMNESPGSKRFVFNTATAPFDPVFPVPKSTRRLRVYRDFRMVIIASRFRNALEIYS